MKNSSIITQNEESNQQQTSQINDEVNMTNYPQPFFKIPVKILISKSCSTIASICIPLVLEWIYVVISPNNLLTPLFCFMLLVAGSFLTEIITDLLIFNLKIKTKLKISEHIVRTLTRSSEDYPLLNTLTAQLPLYVDSYYVSYLCLVFQSIKLCFIIAYLWNKLGIVLFLGLLVCAIVVYSTLLITKKIQFFTFNNVAIREKKISLLKQYLSRVTQFKMSWLDNVIRDKLMALQKQYLYNLERNKMLDCWCVGLWQFTSLGASAIVLSAYYLWGNNQNADFYPATIIYYFNMMSFPLNGISWFIAGLRSSIHAIQNIKENLQKAELKNKQESTNFFEWQQYDDSVASTKKITLKNPQNGKMFQLDPFQLRKGYTYLVYGEDSSFLLQQISRKSLNYPICFAEQNSWHQSKPEQSLHLQPNYNGDINLKHIIKQIDASSYSTNIQLNKYRSLFKTTGCEGVPMHNPTQTYSGGEKMRFSLARAFNFKGIIVIDSELTSLDQQLRKKVFKQIQKKANKENLIILIKAKTKNAKTHATITFKGNKLCIRSRRAPIQEEQFQVNLTSALSQKEHSGVVSQFKTQSVCIYQIKQKQTNKVRQVSLETYKLYFSSYLHIFFLVSIATLNVLKHGYTYYMNTTKSITKSQSEQLVINIMIYLLGYCAAIFFRSYLFAKANIQEAKFLSQKIINSITMNQIDFYRNQGQKIMQKQQSNLQLCDFNRKLPFIKKNQSFTPSQLIQFATSDSQTICSGFPFHTNILFNNIFQVAASFLIMIYEVPLLGVFAIFLIIGAKKIDGKYRVQSQRMEHIIKNQENKVIKTLNHLQKGKKVLNSFKRTQLYIQDYLANLRQQTDLDSKSNLLRVNMNLSFRGSVVVFMGLGIFLFVNSSNDTQKNLQLSVLANYAMLLAHYLLYLTFSINDSHMKAVSIERVRYLIQPNQGVIQRKRLAVEKENHLKDLMSKQIIIDDQTLIKMQNFSFSYGDAPIIKNTNFQLKRGQKVKLQGKSGAGKTTLFKLLTELYPNRREDSLKLSKNMHVSLSPQHPLLIPHQKSVTKNIDPLNYLKYTPQQFKKHFVQQMLIDFGQLGMNQNVQDLSYEKQLLINNYRGYLYGYNGITIYDEPNRTILNEKTKKYQTYLVISHHKDFEAERKCGLANGQISQNNK